jgi:hypothetical protein
MPPTVRQTNFGAGELAPLYWGRTDLGIHPKGLRRCRNFAVLKSGAAMSRPGTTFVAETAGGNVTEHPPRLIPFVYSDEQAYLCEFGDDLAGDGGYIRIYRLGNLVANITGTRIPAADLPKLKFAQTGNILTVCIPNIVFLTPMELRRVDDVTWTWTATQFAPPAALLPDVGSSAMANPFNPGAVPTLKGTTPFSLKLPLPTTDTSHPAREWIYAFTSILQRLSDGAVLESVATVVKYSTDGVEDLVHFGPGSDAAHRPPGGLLLRQGRDARAARQGRGPGLRLPCPVVPHLQGRRRPARVDWRHADPRLRRQRHRPRLLGATAHREQPVHLPRAPERPAADAHSALGGLLSGAPVLRRGAG